VLYSLSLVGEGKGEGTNQFSSTLTSILSRTRARKQSPPPFRIAQNLVRLKEPNIQEVDLAPLLRARNVELAARFFEKTVIDDLRNRERLGDF